MRRRASVVTLMTALVAVVGVVALTPRALSGERETPTCDALAWQPTFGPIHALNNTVWALTSFDDGTCRGPALYAGGQFTIAGSGMVHRIARWDGAAWTPLGGGIADAVPFPYVRALTVFDDGLGGGPALYAGGQFETAGGVTVNNIAKWDGTSWSALGAGLNGAVGTLAVFDDGSGSGPALYAGGDFTVAEGAFARRVAKWNGTSWSPLGEGMNGSVAALAVFDDGLGGGPALYAAGIFTTAGEIEANRIAKWNGSTWSTVGTGMVGAVNALTVYDDQLGGGPALYACGAFPTAGGVTVNGIARWDGAAWTALGMGINDVGTSLAVFDDGAGTNPALYAGGWFSTAGGVSANRVARWDGTSWSALDAGTDGFVTALAAVGHGLHGRPALYVGGSFTTSLAGDAYLARWACADPLPPCAPGDVNCDGAVDGGDLAVVLGAWGACDSSPCDADFNGDGVIDGCDLTFLLGHWAP